MTRRFVAVLAILLTVAVGLSFAQTSSQCKDQATSAKASCCMQSTKAKMTSNTETAVQSQAKIITVSDKTAKNCSMKNCTMKSCTMKGAKNTTEASAKGVCKDPSKCTGAKAMTNKEKATKSSDLKGGE